MIVAIDGPAGAGKSTVARAAADALGFLYLDTGALYRAVAVAARHARVDASDAAALAGLAATIRVDPADGRVLVGERDVTAELRDPEATASVSLVAAHPEVRAALIPVQRRGAETHDVVVEGRDIGTTVFPGAGVKIFLTAEPAERARRRARQLGRANEDEVARVAREISQRDELDSARAASPLMMAEDSVLLDTTDLTLDEVVARVVAIVRGEP